MVQVKTFAPNAKAVKPEVGEVGVVMVPAPEVNVQRPEPTTGALPAKVEVPGTIQTS